MRLVPNELS